MLELLDMIDEMEDAETRKIIVEGRKALKAEKP